MYPPFKIPSYTIGKPWLSAPRKPPESQRSNRNKNLNASRKLTYRQLAFVWEYLSTYPRDATIAAINAGYSPKAANKQSNRLLNDPVVRIYMGNFMTDFRYDRPEPPTHKGGNLTDKQWSFIENYLNRGEDGRYHPITAKEAAIRAGYSPHTAKVMGCNLLKHKWIRYYLELALGERKTLRAVRDRAVERAGLIRQVLFSR
jgi:phage terminase small subunit